MSELKENLENMAIDDKELEDVSGGRYSYDASECQETFEKGTLNYRLYNTICIWYRINPTEIKAKMKEYGAVLTLDALTSDTTFTFSRTDNGNWSITNITF